MTFETSSDLLSVSLFGSINVDDKLCIAGLTQACEALERLLPRRTAAL